MNLGDKIRELRDGFGLTQGQLAGCSSVSQGYLSQLENGEVKNPSAAVLLRVAQAMHVDPDELFEAAGYPTVRTLRQIYEGYQSTIEPDLLRYLSRFPRERQRRLLLLLEGMENLLGQREGNGGGQRFQLGDEEEETGPGHEEHAPDARLSRLQG
jgi:transcriptional regulator with XRE-family HTH domain